MLGANAAVMDKRGRVVVPSEVRRAASLVGGTPLVFLAAPNGVVLLTRDQLLNRVQDDMAGLGLVDELLAERRKVSAEEDE